MGSIPSGDIDIGSIIVFLSCFVNILQDLILRGGQNVYPAEIEYFLHTHPKIQDVQVRSTIIHPVFLSRAVSINCSVNVETG